MATLIKTKILPRTEYGNDANDNRSDPNYLEGIEPKNLNMQLSTMHRAATQNVTEDNVALIFEDIFKEKFRYCPQSSKWLEYVSTHFQEEETGLVLNQIRDLVRKVNTSSHATAARSSFVSGVEKLMKSSRTFAVHGDKFDQDNFLLNTPSGTYNLLHPFDLKPHNPLDLITHITSVSPSEPYGRLFHKFLDEITVDDKELQEFLQVSLGAMLSGAIEDHWIMFWIGSGRNGKNVLGDLIQKILGTYAKKVPSATLLSTNRETHPTTLANLKGIRVAISSEIPEGSFMNDALVKELTGDPTISARYMRQDFFEFKRTHKHLVYGNTRPQIRSIDQGIQSRLRIVPFKACFAGREDTRLPEKLWIEAPYVLHWLMEGHQKWLDKGRKLGTCAAVADATNDYFASQSTPGLWFEECCQIVGDEGQVGRYWDTSSELYASYSEWKKERGENPITHTEWGYFMRKNFKRIKSDGIRYTGLKLAPIC